MPSPTFLLTAFGGLRLSVEPLTDREAAELAAQLESRRRTLALLLVLGTAPRPISRDVLADYFWPDSDPSRARHSLAESLRVIRGALGPDAVATRTPALSLDASAPIRIDVVDFRRAVSEKRWSDAVALHAAEFLDGIHMDRAPRFEHWADEQRVALRTMFGEACAHHLAERRRHGLGAEDVDVARRWLASSPLSGDAAIAWLETMAAPRTALAVRTTRERYEAWRASLREEFDEAPDDRVVSFMASLDATARPASVAPAPASPPAPDEAPRPARSGAPAVEPSSVAPPQPVEQATPEPAHPAEAARRTPPAAPTNPGGTRWGWPLGAAALLLVAVLAFRAFTGRGDLRRGLPDGQLLVVLADAEVARTDTSLADAVTIAVRLGLTGDDAMRLLSPRRTQDLRRLLSIAPPSASSTSRLSDSLALAVAQRAGASAVVVPIVVALGSQYRIGMRVIRAQDGVEIASSQSAPIDSTALLVAIDDVVRATRSALGASRSELSKSAPLPDVTTASLPALRAYAMANAAYRNRDYQATVTWYKRAAEIDSTFAMAWIALGGVLSIRNAPLSADSAFARALPELRRLTPREQVVSRANIARWRFQFDSSIAIRQAWVNSHPDDVEMLEGLAYDLLQDKQYRASADLFRRVVARDSTDELNWLNLGVALRSLGASHEAVAAVSRSIDLVPDQLRDAVFGPQYASMLLEAGMPDSASRVLQGQLGHTPGLDGRMYRMLGNIALWRGRSAEAADYFSRAIEGSAQSGEPLSILRSVLWREVALRDAGDTARARALRDSLPDLARHPRIQEPIALYWAGKRLARAGARASAREVLRLTEARQSPDNPSHRAALLSLRAEVAVLDGRAREAVAFAQEGARLDSNFTSRETLAHAHWRAGERDAAIASYDLLSRERPLLGTEASFVVQQSSYVLDILRHLAPAGGVPLPGPGAMRAVTAPGTR